MADHSARETLDAMKMAGVSLPRHPLGQMDTAMRVQETLTRLDGKFGVTMDRKASAGDTTLVMPKYFDPRMTNQAGYPGMLLNMENDQQRTTIQDWCRLFYSTHPIVGACIDIYSRFPVAGIELRSKDPALTSFYNDLFLNDLDYEDFLIDLGKEYWTVGEAFPFGAWDEDLGLWAAEELLDPVNIEVKRMPLTGQNVYMLEPPQFMTELVRNRNPLNMYIEFERQFPELIPFIERGEKIPVSTDVLSHIARRDNRRAVRGTPILMRGFKTLLIEDRMEAAMQAVADRLYSPLILFKLGVQDLGDGKPWIPSPTQMDDFKSTLDAALVAEFRALITHFGIDVSEAIPQKNISSFQGDREMLDARMFEVFGLSADLLSTSSSQPYASSALRIEFINQILSSYQRFLVKHYEARARVVAEAQGHYDYEKKGDSRVPIYEDYLTYDDEGNKVIKSRPKLLYPKMHMQTMNFRDENTEREFLMTLKEAGVPISDSDVMIGVPFDFKEGVKRTKDETVERELSIAATHKAIYDAAMEQGLPVPPSTSEYMAMGAPVGLGGEEDAAEAGEAAPADKALERERAQKEMESLDAQDATGGGGRPNVSDNKKKDAPKQKAASVVAEEPYSPYELTTVEGKDVFLHRLPEPANRVVISMVADVEVATETESDGEGDE